MGQYLLSIIITGIISALILIISPNESQRKYISYILALITTLVLISPIKEIFKVEDIAFENVSNGSNETDYIEIASRSLAISVSNTLKKEFNIKADKIDIITEDAEKFRVSEIRIYLRKKENESRIEEYTEKIYNCRVKIYYENS